MDIQNPHTSRHRSSFIDTIHTWCEHHLTFEKWAEVTGYLYVSLDTGEKINFRIDEKIYRADFDGMFFTKKEIVDNETGYQTEHSGSHDLWGDKAASNNPAEMKSQLITEDLHLKFLAPSKASGEL